MSQAITTALVYPRNQIRLLPTTISWGTARPFRYIVRAGQPLCRKSL